MAAGDVSRTGHVVGSRYLIGEELDEGGMGVLYEATHTQTRRRLVVKFLKPDVASDEHAVKRFFQEARAAAALAHPNVVDVLDLGHDHEGTPYAVLERLEGMSLEERLESGGAMPVAETLEVLLPVMDALSVAHNHAIVHRDIKPSNIYLSQDPRGRLLPKLLDFGMAKLLERRPGSTSAPVTRPGSVLGTLHYVPPEHIMEEGGVGPSYDIWALGVVLYRCLSGELPYQASRMQALLVKIATMEPPPLEEVAPHVPGPLVMAVMRCLVRERAHRTPTVPALVEELAAAAAASGIALSASARMAIEATAG